MRHNEPQRIAVVGRERLAIVVCSEQYLVTVEISQRHIGSEALLGVDQNILCLRLELHQVEHFLEGDALPVIIEAAPACDAMEIAVRPYSRQPIELLPAEPHRLLYQPANAEVPFSRIKARHRAIMQDRPLQRERLPRRQPSLAFHLLLFFLTLIASKDAASLVHEIHSK